MTHKHLHELSLDEYDSLIRKWSSDSRDDEYVMLIKQRMESIHRELERLAGGFEDGIVGDVKIVNTLLQSLAAESQEFIKEIEQGEEYRKQIDGDISRPDHPEYQPF